MSDGVDHDVTVDTLRANACPRCDYSLIGLPVIGICPECGRPYDDASVFLYGHALGQRANAWSRRPMRPKELVWSSVGTAVFLAFLMLHRIHDSIFTIYMLCMIGGPTLVSVLRSRSDIGSGVVQVKLTRKGFHQGTRQLGPIPFERCDEAELIPWNKASVVQLSGGGSRLRIKIAPNYLWWKLQARREYVNADVACTPVQLEALRERIAAWRGAAV
jgi:hypothetical protein